MKKIIYILFFFLAVSCKKDKITPPAPDPCIGLQEVSADFTMEEMTSGNLNFAKFTNTDTIYANKNVQFSAVENNATYTWYIGSEIITSKTFKRYFSSSLIGQTIPISLAIKKESNKKCFPNDDGYDSITKFLTIVANNYFDGSGTIHFEGIYKVKSPLLNDSSIITIDYFHFGPSADYINIINYDGQGSNCIDTFGQAIYLDGENINYSQLWFNNPVDAIGDAIHGDIKLYGHKIELNIKSGRVISNGNITYLYDWKYKGRKL